MVDSRSVMPTIKISERKFLKSAHFGEDSKFDFYYIISVAKEAKVEIPFAGRRVGLPMKLLWSNTM